jgi:hypothetical protein
MKLSIIGPGIMPIPPQGWGAVEILIWDLKCAYEELGHEVQIINTQDGNEILKLVNDFNPDFVHIQYDDMIGIYPYITLPKAITTHFAYLQSPEKIGGYSSILDAFSKYSPNIFALSQEIKNVYQNLGIPEQKIFVTPNGVNSKNFRVTNSPKYSDRSIYLAKIDPRKRQNLFQSIDSLWYAGNIADDKFDRNKNYLGEWSKEILYNELTEYGNLVLLSDGEAHPLVCMEALASGLGLVVSEYAKANLDLDKKFITVIPENKINDIEYIELEIIKNRKYSISNREEILQYSKKFEWKTIVENYYIPSMKNLIEEDKSNKKTISLQFMDKNKAAYKLKNLSPIYYLNLDGQPERKEYMEEQFKYWEIENYTRISAYDGREDDLSDIIKGRYPDNMTSGEIGCTTSHLKALQHWIETSDSPYAIIMEDDVDLQLARCWNFTWNDIIAKVPYDYDVIQLAIICTGDLHVKLHKRFVNDFSTAAYMITRHHAEKILRHHVRGDKYKLDNGAKPRAVADDLIYNSGNTFSIPLFLYKIALGSSIHPEHIDVFHRQSHDGLLHFWETQGTDMTIDDLMNYDPYLGRITNPSPPQS